jgi:hypothetical protein
MSTKTYFNMDYTGIQSSLVTLYDDLVPLVFQGSMPASPEGYPHAYDIWDYTNYQYKYNSTVRNNLSVGTLEQLRDLASKIQFSLNGNLSVSGITNGDMIRAVGGRTLAAKVVNLLGTNIGSGGLSPKLSLLFGTFSPFLSLFSIAGLSDHDDRFKSLPLDASVMVFELFSNSTTSTTMPSIDDLRVRFLYRNGTDYDVELTSYPLFGREHSQIDMQWLDFVNLIKKVEVADMGNWCGMCNTSSVFCNPEDNMSHNIGGTHDFEERKNFKVLNPFVAGVIGYVIAVAVFMISLLFAVVFGCLRVRYMDRKSSLGGFEDDEKVG